MLCVMIAAVHATVFAHGQPKSGTSWLGVIIETLVKKSCEDGASANCLRLLVAEKEEAKFVDRETTQEVLLHNVKHSLPGAADDMPSGVRITAVDSAYNATVASCVDRGLAIWSPGCMPRSKVRVDVLGANRYVLIVRDPRAVVVSAFHYFKETGFEAYCRDKVPKTAALTSLRYYWHAELVATTNPSLIVFYEDLLDDTVNEYYKIASFLRLQPSLHTMVQVAAETSANTMRARSVHASKLRRASPESFRVDMRPFLADVTRAMIPLLHPALLSKYVYNLEDLNMSRH